MEGCRQERRGIEGKGYGGAEGTGIAENLPMGHSCRGPQGPSKPGKNARSTEENRVRSRQVTPSRKTAVIKHHAGRPLVSITRRVVRGSAGAIAAVLAATGTGTGSTRRISSGSTRPS